MAIDIRELAEPQTDRRIAGWVWSENQQRAMADQAFLDGLAITRSDGTQVPIPIATAPVIVADAEMARRATSAKLLASATVKAANWRLRSKLRDGVLAALGPTERRVLASRKQGKPAVLAVLRVDCLGNPVPMALEVNATIPAMQGYSDIAATAWLSHVLPGHPELPKLIRDNGSNVEALLLALQAAHRDARGHEADGIALLCRRGDAQRTELDYIAKRFNTLGVTTGVIHPDETRLNDGWLEAQGRRWPLVYRHLFVHRLEHEPNEAIEHLLASPSDQGTLILNPPAPHVEMKSTLALLSESVDKPTWTAAMGLTPEETNVVATLVPWTRWLSDPDPNRPAVARHWMQELLDTPESFVLKRSWSYGGRDVFFGRNANDADRFEPARRLFPGVRDWQDLCQRAASDRGGGGFVVQRVVPVHRDPITFATPDHLRTVEATTDFSMFASFGVDAPWTGVCRAAASDIVNIAGGGGVVPLLRQSVADRVATAIQRSGTTDGVPIQYR